MASFFGSALLLSVACSVLGCHRFMSQQDEAPTSSATRPPLAASTQPPAETGPLRIEALDPNETPATFVMRGGRPAPGRIVFLHGMCGHAHGYAQSFQYSAARYGSLVAPQADVVCGKGPWAKWSADTDALDARITSAFKSLGHQEPIDDVLVIGYSQGATRAEALARKWPERYTRLILMGAPTATQAHGLKHLRATVMMAGERDRQDLMKQSARALTASSIPSTFIMIPEATHGAMGPTPEKTMQEALDWVFRNSRPKLAAATEKQDHT
jgi:pimeloyl-ACP methyl ester carboxylesterase